MKSLFVTLAVLMFTSFAAFAFQVEPMIQVLQESGRKANATFRVENTSDAVLELEVELLKRGIRGREKETLFNADDFIIMPPMAEIQPGEYQVFRVRYLGKQPLSKAESYRLFFRQLPIQDSSTIGSEVKFLFNIGALLFVDPITASPDLFASIEGEQIVLSNQGSGVADLSDFTLSIHAQEQAMAIPWQNIAQYGSVSFLLPEQETVIPLSNWYELESPPDEVSVLR